MVYPIGTGITADGHLYPNPIGFLNIFFLRFVDSGNRGDLSTVPHRIARNEVPRGESVGSQIVPYSAIKCSSSSVR